MYSLKTWERKARPDNKPTEKGFYFKVVLSII